MSNSLKKLADGQLDALVVRARTERKAFGRLYDQIYPPLFRYSVRRTGNRSLAEDITSAVFLKVVDKIATFPGETYVDFRRWIYAIATNEINATYRKSARRQSLLVEAAESGRLRGKTTNDSPSCKPDADSVQAAMMQLTQRDQTVITLRFFAELPYEDIGRILNISSGAARIAASRALDRIKNELGRQA